MEKETESKSIRLNRKVQHIDAVHCIYIRSFVLVDRFFLFKNTYYERKRQDRKLAAAVFSWCNVHIMICLALYYFVGCNLLGNKWKRLFNHTKTKKKEWKIAKEITIWPIHMNTYTIYNYFVLIVLELLLYQWYQFRFNV